MSDFKIKILNNSLYSENDTSITLGRTLVACATVIIPPKTDHLIPLGVTFSVPDDYLFDTKLKEELVDKSLGLIGQTFAPINMGSEFGVMVFNYNKQSVRIEETDSILTFNLIKVENLEITIID